MAFTVFQALTCWAAARTIDRRDEGPGHSAVHAVANGMDCCASYASHKYIDTDPIEAFMGAQPGSGVVGFWSFRDGSRLVYLCPDYFPETGKFGPCKFCVLTPADPEGTEDPEPAYRMDMRTWSSDPAGGELRKESA